MPGMDSLTISAIIAAQLARIQMTGANGSSSGGGGGGGPAIPDVALRFNDPYWEVVTGNTETPDGYFVFIDGQLNIDPDATSGEPISVVDGEILVGS